MADNVSDFKELVRDIESKKILLPDFQRDFVWKDEEVEQKEENQIKKSNRISIQKLFIILIFLLLKNFIFFFFFHKIFVYFFFIANNYCFFLKS